MMNNGLELFSCVHGVLIQTGVFFFCLLCEVLPTWKYSLNLLFVSLRYNSAAVDAVFPLLRAVEARSIVSYHFISSFVDEVIIQVSTMSPAKRSYSHSLARCAKLAVLRCYWLFSSCVKKRDIGMAKYLEMKSWSLLRTHVHLLHLIDWRSNKKLNNSVATLSYMTTLSIIRQLYIIIHFDDWSSQC